MSIATKVFAALEGCGETNNMVAIEDAARACTPPRSGWMRPGPFDGAGVIVNRLAVDRNGVLRWNRQPRSMAQISQYLSTVPAMNPRGDHGTC